MDFERAIHVRLGLALRLGEGVLRTNTRRAFRITPGLSSERDNSSYPMRASQINTATYKYSTVQHSYHIIRRRDQASRPQVSKQH